jgi:hypothetical protein
MRAPNHGFSQLAASFIACPHLGIPRVPLLRLTSIHLTAGCRVRLRVRFRVTLRGRGVTKKQLSHSLSLTPTLSRSLTLTLPSNRSGPPVQYFACQRSSSRRSQSPELSNIEEHAKCPAAVRDRMRDPCRAELHKIQKPLFGSTRNGPVRRRRVTASAVVHHRAPDGLRMSGTYCVKIESRGV